MSTTTGHDNAADQRPPHNPGEGDSCQCQGCFEERRKLNLAWMKGTNMGRSNRLGDDAEMLAAVAKRVATSGPSGGKAEFHRVGKRFLKEVLLGLGVTGDVRSSLGGPGVVGEVILHTDKVYVQLCTSSFGGPVQFMYRTCKGRKDYSGGGNQWFSYDQLAADPEKFVDILKRMS